MIAYLEGKILKALHKTKKALVVTLAVSMTGVYSSTVAILPAHAQPTTTQVQASTIGGSVVDYGINGDKLQLNATTTMPTRNQGNPIVKSVRGISDKAVYFDGRSAVIAPFGTAQKQQINGQLTMEAYFKAEDIPSSGEMDFFSNQQSGGVGLGFENGQLTFYGYMGDHYVTPKATVNVNKWIHVVGVISQTDVALYVNGQLVQSLPKSGELKFTTSQDAQNLVLGGDSNATGGAEYLFRGFVNRARLYNRALTATEVSALSKNAHEHDVTEPLQVQNLQAGLIGANTTVQDSLYDLNLQLRGETEGDLDHLNLDLNYDPQQVAFKGLRNNSLAKNVTVVDDHQGKLHISYQGPIATAALIDYAQTMLAQLTFTTLPTKTNQTAHFKISDVKGSAAGQTVTPQLTLGDKQLQILANDALDYNHDGLISVGDAVLAPADQQVLIAQKAAIYPYKHVMVLTTDGGGNPWNPSGLYYTNGIGAPQWTTNPTILAKRQNPFALNFFSHEAAMSTSAHAVFPTISGMNYASILHGLQWGELPPDYQLNNTSAGRFYFNDFGKSTSQYPSIFKVINQYQPQRSNTVFSEWSPIPNGIVEPDAAVHKEFDSTPGTSYRKIADYINSPAFNKTAFTYLQDDSMDERGHSTGFFNDRYWQDYHVYDERFKSVIDSLKKTGHANDTLVIFNADHGGTARTHGGSSSSESNIFIALYGQTVAKGWRLTGGNNSDITPVALNALRLPQPASMTGKVFDQTAFMPQTELTANHRDTDQVFVGQSKQAMHFTLNKKHDIKAVDLVLDLNGQPKGTLQVNGGKILRDQVENGQWKITVTYDKLPNDFLTITPANVSGKIQVKEMMLASADGQESYNDISEYRTDQLDAALQKANQIKPQVGYHFTTNSQQQVTKAQADVKTLLQSADITTAKADALAGQLNKAVAALKEERNHATIVNKNQLQNELQKATQRQASMGHHFTQSSAAKLTAAVKAAKLVLANTKATQAEVDHAIQDLLVATKGLTETADQTTTTVAQHEKQPAGTDTNNRETATSAKANNATSQSANVSGTTSNQNLPQTGVHFSHKPVIVGALLALIVAGISWWRVLYKKPGK